MIQRAYLILKEIFSSRFISLIVFFSILTSVFSAGLFEIIGSNFNSYINIRFASSIPPNTMKIVPKKGKTFLLFQFSDPDSIKLNDAALKKIRRINGVRTIYPVMTARVPMQARISLFTFRYRTDLLSIGVPYKLVKDDIKGSDYRRMWKNPSFEGEIPVLIPDSVLSAYNDGMAEPNGLPKISESSATGLGFQLFFGHSSIKSFNEYNEVSATVAGFTDRINALALIIPISVARYYNKKFNNDNSHKEYLYAFVKVGDHRSLLRASKSIRKMGFNVEVEKSISRQILNLKRNVNIVIESLKFLIIIISMIAVSFSTMIATMGRVEY